MLRRVVVLGNIVYLVSRFSGFLQKRVRSGWIPECVL